MDRSIEQLGQDLARAAYAKSTQERYVKAAQKLADRFAKPIANVTRDELRLFVDEVSSSSKSYSQIVGALCALQFLYRRTLGRASDVSFIKLPSKYSALPPVLSLGEVDALLKAIRKPRYQAIAMVMYGAGLRISEALALEVDDMRVERLRIPHLDRLHAALRALRADYTVRTSHEIRISLFAN